MKTSCNIIQDLLPLYVDGDCSTETRELVEAHLKECPECSQLCRQMGMPIAVPEHPANASESVIPDAFRKIRRSNLIRTVAICAVLLFVGFSIMKIFENYSMANFSRQNYSKEYRAKRLWEYLREEDVDGFIAELDPSAYYDKACQNQLGASGLSPYNLDERSYYNFSKLKQKVQLGDTEYIGCIEEMPSIRELEDLAPLFEKYVNLVLTEQDYHQLMGDSSTIVFLADFDAVEWNGQKYYFYSPTMIWGGGIVADSLLADPQTGETIGIYTSPIYSICSAACFMPVELFEAFEEEATFYQDLYSANADEFQKADKAQFAEKWLAKAKENVELLLAENGPLTIITNGERSIFNEGEYLEDTAFAEMLLVFTNNHAVLADCHMGLENNHMYVEFIRGIKPDVEIRK